MFLSKYRTLTLAAVTAASFILFITFTYNFFINDNFYGKGVLYLLFMVVSYLSMKALKQVGRLQPMVQMFEEGTDIMVLNEIFSKMIRQDIVEKPVAKLKQLPIQNLVLGHYAFDDEEIRNIYLNAFLDRFPESRYLTEVTPQKQMEIAAEINQRQTNPLNRDQPFFIFVSKYDEKQASQMKDLGIYVMVISEDNSLPIPKIRKDHVMIDKGLPVTQIIWS